MITRTIKLAWAALALLSLAVFVAAKPSRAPQVGHPSGPGKMVAVPAEGLAVGTFTLSCAATSHFTRCFRMNTQTGEVVEVHP